MSPPLDTQTSGITGTRTKAEIRRELADRFNAAARRADIALTGWQVRGLIATVIADHEEPSDHDLILALMRAPWFPKHHRRRFQVGEVGWRTHS
jgi:hypothetical protein